MIFVTSPLFGVFAFAGLVPTLFTLVWVVRLLTNPYGASWHDKSARSIVAYRRGTADVEAEIAMNLIVYEMWPRVGS